MKKLTFICFVSVLLMHITLSGKAQNITIPDANFKQALVNNSEINTDGDSEISQSEAAAFSGEMDVSDRSIADLSGIEYFTKLTKLSCVNNQLNFKIMKCMNKSLINCKKVANSLMMIYEY